MFDWVPLAQTVLYALVLLFGLMVAVPMGITKSHFDDECVLYADLDGSWPKSGELSNCNYVIYMQVVLSIMMGGILAGAFVFILISEFRGTVIEMRTNFFVLLGMVILHSLAAFLSFICACIITVGFKELCEDIEEILPTCKDAQTRLRWPPGINGSDFHDNVSLAVAAAWCNLATWILLIALATYVMIRVKQGSYPAGAQTVTTTTTRTSMSGSRTTVKSTTSSQKTFSIA